jgi:hypothetical protein
MGTKRVGLARTQALIENLKRDLNLNGTTLSGANTSLPTADASGYAFGKITVDDETAITNAETFVLVSTDGTEHTFTFNTSNTVTTNNNVGINGENTNAVAASIAAAINDNSATTKNKISASATNAVVNLIQLAKGASGNTTITDNTGDAALTVVNFVGGNTPYGPGAVSTEIAPQVFTQTVNDEIITTIKVDLTGLGNTNQANGVLGLDSGAAYLLRYETAVHGILYKVEMSCLETPASAGAETKDIDLTSNASGLLIKNDDGGSSKLLTMGGPAAKGTTFQNLVTGGGTDEEYLYLTEGGTPADIDYTAGKFVIKLYGRASF